MNVNLNTALGKLLKRKILYLQPSQFFHHKKITWKKSCNKHLSNFKRFIKELWAWHTFSHVCFANYFSLEDFKRNWCSISLCKQNIPSIFLLKSFPASKLLVQNLQTKVAFWSKNRLLCKYFLKKSSMLFSDFPKRSILTFTCFFIQIIYFIFNKKNKKASSFFSLMYFVKMLHETFYSFSSVILSANHFLYSSSE